MEKIKLVSVIVPALNESPTLVELFMRTKSALEGSWEFEFIFVDDGSIDNTIEVVNQLQREFPNVKLLGHYRNHGKSVALMQGFALAEGEVAITMDADLQDHPELIPEFLKKIAEGYDLVNGYRVSRKDSSKKIFVSKIFNFLTSKLMDCPLHDINCGFKAIRKDVYKKLNLRGDLHRLIPAMASSRGFKITEIPISHSERKVGISRYQLLRHRGLLDLIALTASTSTRTRPFHVFSELAAVCFVFAAICGISFFSIRRTNSLFAFLAKTFFKGFGIWAVFFGSILPLLGLNLEISGSKICEREWYDSLLKIGKQK